jgi:GTP cyclohydrolase I
MRRLELAVREILLALGEDPDREALVESRVEWRMRIARCSEGCVRMRERVFRGSSRWSSRATTW